MLNKLRNFSKSKLAGLLVAIIIIPFVFWGMGSVFSGGNTNSIAKINNHNISTQDFTDFINNSKISSNVIKENIDNNIIEELLTQLVSNSLIDIEIDEMNYFISDNILVNKIKNEKSFQDENNNFSRTKYEKFLLESNTHSVEFERDIRENELKKKLFTYINGGIKSPFFLANKLYKEQLKIIEVDYLELDSLYIDKNNISIDELRKHVSENKEKFLIDKVDISLIKITPENISGETEFNDNFFSKIDQIEDLIISNKNINEIAKEYSLNLEKFSEYYPGKDSNDLLEEIYKNRNIKVIDLVDKNDFFLLYEIKNIKKILPNLDDNEFLDIVKNDFFQINKYNLHKDLLTKISKKEFTNDEFLKLSKGIINNLTIKSIKDTGKFTKESVNLIYSLNLNKFTLVSDNLNNVYLVKIKKVYENNLTENSQEVKSYTKESNIEIRENLYNSYDLLLNEKYKIKINQNTLDRIKNYFR